IIVMAGPGAIRTFREHGSVEIPLNGGFHLFPPPGSLIGVAVSRAPPLFASGTLGAYIWIKSSSNGKWEKYGLICHHLIPQSEAVKSGDLDANLSKVYQPPEADENSQVVEENFFGEIRWSSGMGIYPLEGNDDSIRQVCLRFTYGMLG